MSDIVLKSLRSPSQRWIKNHSNHTLGTLVRLSLQEVPDAGQFTASFRQVLSRHHILGASGTDPYQEAPSLEVLDAAGLADANGREADPWLGFKRRIVNERAFRVWLVQSAGGAKVFLYLPAVIGDTLSAMHLCRELIGCYRGGDTLPPSAPPLQFAQYAAWHNDLLDKPGAEAEMFWQQFSDRMPLPRKLTVEKNGGQTRDSLLDSIRFAIPGGYNVHNLSGEERLHGESFILTCWSIVLAQYLVEEDYVMGRIGSGRSYDLFEKITGPFSRPYPVDIAFPPSTTFTTAVREVTARLALAQGWQDYLDLEKFNPPQTASAGSFFPFGFELIPADEPLRQFTDECIEDVYALCEPFKLKLLALAGKADVQFQLYFDPALYDRQFVVLLRDRFTRIFNKAVADPEVTLADLRVATAEDLQYIAAHAGWKDDHAGWKGSFKELFEERALTTPDLIAVHYEGQHLTFGQLNARANQLGAYLRRHFGLRSEDIVAVKCERSIEMIVALLAIIKAGGVFLPVDAQSPEARLNTILADSNARLLITSGDTVARTVRNVTQVDIKRQEEAILQEDVRNLPAAVGPSSGVYVIYTSGSTGQPKGVMVSHGALVNYLTWFIDTYQISVRDRTLILSSVAFDLTYTSLFSSLIAGASLHLLKEQEHFDAQDMIDAVIAQGITYLKLTPSHFGLLVNDPAFDEQQQSKYRLRLVILGGEEINVADVQKYVSGNPDCLFVNHYGPTETTIGTAVREISSHTLGKFAQKPVIGKPIRNNKVIILDDAGRVAPVGVPGEICIAGAGLANGYLNSPVLTGEKFAWFDSGAGFFNQRLYRSGDAGFLLADGNIAFLGRKDNQVKINGFRVDTGEVEHALEGYPGIDKAVVIPVKNAGGKHELYGYLCAGSSVTVASLNAYLRERIPQYMIPKDYKRVPAIPLTPNGKVNRKKLLEMPAVPLVRENAVELPANEVEQKLVEVWKSVLNCDGVGVNDNFFHVGGDSIKAIQVASRMHASGYKLNIRNLLKFPVLKQMAAKVEVVRQAPDQSSVQGVIPLTPIQARFLRNIKTDPHHYNQSFLLRFDQTLDRRTVEILFDKLLAHHDMLRVTFRREGSRYVQVANGTGQRLAVEEVDLAEYPDAASRFQAHATDLQRRLDITQGPLVKVALFHFAGHAKLLVVIHHLIVDFVSWRILLEDLNTLVQQHQQGAPLQLPPKTSSYKAWSESLRAYAGSDDFAREKGYWENQAQLDVPAIQPDWAQATNLVRDEAAVSFALTEAQTHVLQARINPAFGTNMNDVLITAVVVGFREVFGHNRLSIDLEGHGREDVQEAVDTNRTVGWFTSIYPVVLDACGKGSLVEELVNVKETLHKVPRGGIAYGVMRYLGNDGATPAGREPASQIIFNYLGQFNSEISQLSYILANEKKGDERSGLQDLLYDFKIGAISVNGILHVSIHYSKNRYREATVNKILASMQEAMTKLVAVADEIKGTTVTPSDFTYKDLSVDDLENIFS